MEKPKFLDLEDTEELKRLSFEAGVKEGKELMSLDIAVKLSNIQEAVDKLKALVESH